jgi:hypothetical protein
MLKLAAAVVAVVVVVFGFSEKLDKYKFCLPSM